MKKSRICLTSAVFCFASIGFEVGAQTCHTVRDKDGVIVYQSTRSPADALDIKQLVADAMQAGGTLRFESNFIRCGEFDRSAGAPIRPLVVDAPAKVDSPLEQAPNSRMVFENEYIDRTYNNKPSPQNAPAQQRVQPPPNPVPPIEVPGGIFKGLTKDDLPASPEKQPDNPVAPVQAPRNNQVSGLGKVVAAGILVGILCAPKKVRNVLLSVFAALFVFAIGFAFYESARPSTLPFAQCVIDNVPAARNDVAAYAAATQCADQYGGYNSAEAKRYVKGQATGFMTPKSRAECVTKHASNTTSEMAAKLVSGACNCLFQSPAEGANETLSTCG